MKVRYHNGTEEVKERVIRELTHYYLTDSGAQVPKAAVISFDRRGGSKPGAGRRAIGEKRIQTPVYLKEKDVAELQKEADRLSISLSKLIAQKLGIE